MGGTTKLLLGIPDRWLARLLRRPVEVDGQRLAADIQLLLLLVRVIDREPAVPTPQQARAGLARGSAIIRGRPIEPVAARDLTVADRLGARLYEPAGLPPGRGLLVFFHGGGWVIGTLETHDNLCRFLAQRAGVRVLSVDYRLAPEAPFPAAVDDAVDAFDWAVANAAELGADPELVGVGGDSAGGNLSVVASLYASARPAFQLLVYPVLDFSQRRRSRELFGAGFYLTDERMDWFEGHYLSGWADKTDPRLSPLLVEDLSGLPPTYLVTAGFDPLRDEGEEFAKRLADAGVPVQSRRQDGLIHGFSNMFNVSPSAHAAMLEVAAALRDGLAPERKAGEVDG